MMIIEPYFCKFSIKTSVVGAYRKSPKFLDAQNVWCNYPKIQAKRFYHRVMHPKDVDSIANSEDPNQTDPLGAV